MWVILKEQNNVRLFVSWIENHESGSYKYPPGVETNAIARKWGMNNMLTKYVQACLTDIWGFKNQNVMGTGRSEYCLSVHMQFKVM